MSASLRSVLRRGAVWLIVAPIRVYQMALSPLFPPSCRFVPTCSQYAIEAVRLHGPVKGLYLALRRILRCHPVRWLGGASGYDPVPPPGNAGASDRQKHASRGGGDAPSGQ